MEIPPEAMEIPPEAMEFMEKSMEHASRHLEKVMIFIDAGYWRKGLEDNFKSTNIDMDKVITKLLRGRRLVRTYFYTAKIERPPTKYWEEQQAEQQRLFTALAHQPLIEVRKGRLQFKGNEPPKQKGVDVLLALDMLRFAFKGNYDTAMLISGDGDFADIVRMVKDEGRKVEIVTFPKSCSPALLEACDKNIEVAEELIEDCWKTKNEEG